MSTPNLSRRGLLMVTALAAPVVALVGPGAVLAADDPYANSPFRKISDAEWRVRLLPASYGVLRHEDTERPGASPLLNEHRKGTFACIGCSLPIFKSEWKF